MFKQNISLINFPELYNILNEIKNLFLFNLVNFETTEEFIIKIETSNSEYSNSIIILNNKNNLLLNNNKVNNENILVFDNKPYRIERIIDLINIHTLKQKYNFQSRLKVKNYYLNLNSRIISKNNISLKLTEREVNLLLFLKDQIGAQSVNNLQNKVWGHFSELDTHTVETHIYRLRKKFLEKFLDKDFIISSNLGYKL